ncbi:YcaO-like family protein [Pseudomonas sp. B2M1-30]|uniref:YcaO-like family protein n=1 Tax=Pseudomonas TaxID=286 RepID=UPI0021C8FDB3|nr:MULTISPECIES: YcaO-like family protein [Pseudomonas]MCU0121128.1 YcaO-like family protein [Pseudomonas sp. B2M1-30]MCU7262757.1 YcaO-like family protein [Pseudomonas koreensis]
MDKTRIAERELTAHQAEQRIRAELSRLGLTATTRTLGSKVLAVQASLHGSDNRLARGSGKGYAGQARLGALYEALEHYWADSLCTRDIHYEAAHYFTDTPMFADDSLLQRMTVLPDARIACRTYVCPLWHDIFSYPVALIAPNCSPPRLPHDTVDYRAVQRYASNSGTAIGASYQEALLHGANECIERDAVSLFLLRHFYYEHRPPLRRVARPHEDDSLGRLWADAEKEIGSEIVLVDISSEFLARTFLAFSAASGAHPRVFGSGCSLDARHAAWRALSELVQLRLAAAEPEYRQTLDNALRHLQPFPRLLRCARFDPRVLLDRCPQHEVRLPDSSEDLPVEEQVYRLLQDVQSHGRTVGATILERTRLGTTLLNVVIPGLERFFVVSGGNVVIPQTRGRRLQRSVA